MLSRYIVVGGLSYIVELTFMYVLLFAGLSSVLSVGISFWVGFIMAFFLQKIFAFKDTTNKSKKRAVMQLVMYSGLVAINYAFTLLLVSFHEPIGSPIYGIVGGWPVIGSIENFTLLFTRTLALGITTIWNFLIYKYLIFVNK